MLQLVVAVATVLGLLLLVGNGAGNAEPLREQAAWRDSARTVAAAALAKAHQNTWRFGQPEGSALTAQAQLNSPVSGGLTSGPRSVVADCRYATALDSGPELAAQCAYDNASRFLVVSQAFEPASGANSPERLQRLYGTLAVELSQGFGAAAETCGAPGEPTLSVFSAGSDGGFWVRLPTCAWTKS